MENNILLPAIISLITVALVSPMLIKLLKRVGMTQPIRAELPQNHQVKQGTPLMLGSVFLIGIIVAIYSVQSALMVFLCLCYLLFSAIGFCDDFWKGSKQDAGGISSKTKLVFQFLFTGVLLYYLIQVHGLSTDIFIHHTLSIELTPFLYFILVTFFIVGTTNAINFTDGLDGLLGIVAIPTFLFFFLISDSTEVQLFSLIMIGSLLGFLLYNMFPAKGFMGDTGSLAIGGTLSFLAIIEKVELLIPLLFIVYLAEKFSVIIQVLSFKLTGKRVFRMTPIHFHFALKYGWSENMTVLFFGIVSWCAVLISLGYWYLFR